MAIRPEWFTGIIDLSHHQEQAFDWSRLLDAGVVAVIHKATEGADFKDDKYHHRRHGAKSAGLLWGSYHFAGDNDCDGVDQADHYLSFTQPESDEFICFDCEKHGTYKNMLRFVERVNERIGRYPAIYGRRLLRDLMRDQEDSPVTRGVLWYDEYPPQDYENPRQELPQGWSDWTLWQYTDGKSGPEPRCISNIGCFDRNAFKGDVQQLRSEWPFARFAPDEPSGLIASALKAD